MNLSVVIVPAKVLSNGMHKIRIAISHNCETRYKVTRFLVPSPKNVKNGRVTGKDVPDAEYINLQLNQLIQRMYKAYDKIEDAECYSCSQLLSLIEDKMNMSALVTMEQISQDWLEYTKNKNSENTYILYNIEAKQFINFFGKDFLVSMLTPSRVKEFEMYLQKRIASNKSKKIENKQISPVTVNMRMDALRFMVNYAIKRKYVSFDVDPFMDCDTYTPIVRDVFVNVTTLRKIRDYKFTNELDIMLQDLFMLSFYLCGMNYVDILSTDLSGDYVEFSRTKNIKTKKDNVKTTFSIQPEARAIIDKYIGKDGKVTFREKKTKDQIVNLIQTRLQNLRDAVDVPNLIYYSARKTFSQTAYMLGIQERVIKYCLGDSIKKERDVIMFYTKTNKQMADEAIRKVFDFVASDKTEEDLYQSSPTKS